MVPVSGHAADKKKSSGKKTTARKAATGKSSPRRRGTPRAALTGSAREIVDYTNGQIKQVRILEISIKRRYETPAGTPEAGPEGFGLSMVTVKGDQAKKGIFSKQLQKYIPGGVPAAVIDKNDLAFAPTGISKALVDLPHRLTFIEDGYDDAELEADVAGRCRGVVLFHRWSVPAAAGLKP